ncbi:Phosphate transport regulator [Cystobacter fuscus DSM 2262]|uniref:Phosphate transport regulator n=1 Tax=Cystobacter fuscus (strain ATCC 25194 / DSM 2262 / NBRC 100088 / M29) TaxID=1242864 RepID=S9PHW2_CYSF2|nr:DUF47 family protein [Cystobacter fuscus]EPX61992.1 Phosphate transport regulator [Cystobacter fuscus DSM 2262]
MLERLMPTADGFHDDFDAQCATTLAGARLFHELLSDYRDVPARVEALERMEHQGNAVNHLALERLHSAFIAPFERTHIHALLSRIDEVLDFTLAAALRLRFYEIPASLPEATQLSRLLVTLTEKLREVVRALRSLRHPEPILSGCKELKQLTREAKDVLRAGKGQLFKSGVDHLTVLKWKEIYDALTSALFKCREAADVIEAIVLTYA